MPENSPSEYEDSYQKKEILEKELSVVLNELQRYIRISKKETGELKILFKRHDHLVKSGKIYEKEIIKISIEEIEKIKGLLGDAEGTTSIIELKRKEIEEIQKQIRELEKEE